MSKDSRKNAIRLIEVVVILVVVLLAIAFMLPAVGASREKARCETCIHNLKEIGLALHTYHDINKKLPPSANLCSETGMPPFKAGGPSFLVKLLPMLGYQTMYDELLPSLENPAAKTRADFFLTDTNENLAKVRDTVIPKFICPSNPNRSLLFPGNTKVGTKIALTNYKRMGATNMVSLSYCLDPKGTTAQPYPPIPAIAAEHPDGVLFPGDGIRFADIIDGPTHTLMAVETMDDSGSSQSDAGSAWVSGACATLVGVPSRRRQDDALITYEPANEEYHYIRPTDFNLQFYYKDAPHEIQALKTYISYDFLGIDKGKYPDHASGANVGNTPANIFGPSAGHPNVVNHLFGDGAARGIRKDVDFCLYFFTITRSRGDYVSHADYSD